MKKLIHKEFGVTIQAGQHDSVSIQSIHCCLSSDQVTDARAMMALFRKYREEWERTQRSIMKKTKSKSKHEALETKPDDGDEDLDILKKVQFKKRKIEELEEAVLVQVSKDMARDYQQSLKDGILIQYRRRRKLPGGPPLKRVGNQLTQADRRVLFHLDYQDDKCSFDSTLS